ncbi:DUF3094 family protein [Halopseudomonas salegens]|uniref:DUF3094 family protein n=1 Tax=Halopseudomonas salegens TaxID=1434072 RepID=A0A1H2GYT0_9GAMM|nr:DUF3094 family protein [Halopseudomonas salegens]SDU24787.1 Protein of unknown function [Halopseudomonas salegens]
MPGKLYPEDQKRVEEYLSSPTHQVERKPFNVWLLLGGITLMVIFMGLLSRLLSWFALG